MKRGRPKKKVDRRILAQQTGKTGAALEGIAELFEAVDGGQHDALDLRLHTRAGAWLQQGLDRDDALERAGNWPDLYNYYLRRGDAAHVALRKQEKWKFGDPLPSDLEASQRPAGVSASRVALALLRMREAREAQVIATFRALTRGKRLPVREAVLETVRLCGWGPGTVDAQGRGKGITEVLKVLRAAAFSEVAAVRLRSPSAPRRR